jgi:hypothetical protein
MPIASFLGKVFQVSLNRRYTLDGLTWSGALDTEAQEKVKDKPSTYIKGFGLETLSFEIPLRAENQINVRTEIEQWEAIRDKAVSGVFILGTRPIGKNKFLLKSVAVSDTMIDGKGLLLKATVKLELEEFVRAGKAAAKNTAGGPATGSTLTPGNYLNPPGKSDAKRNSPALQTALAKTTRLENMYGGLG